MRTHFLFSHDFQHTVGLPFPSIFIGAGINPAATPATFSSSLTAFPSIFIGAGINPATTPATFSSPLSAFLSLQSKIATRKSPITTPPRFPASRRPSFPLNLHRRGNKSRDYPRHVFQPAVGLPFPSIENRHSKIENRQSTITFTRPIPSARPARGRPS